MKRWPRCASCGKLLYSPRNLELLFGDAMTCSEECRMLTENYLEWRSQVRDQEPPRVEIPKFPFFRPVHTVIEYE